jgi:hypothetical protein
MPFIGNQPTSGRFIELDSLTASATANYTLQLNSANFEPESVNNLLVSINGVIQGSSTMSLNGAVLTVGATLSSSDTIDFVRVFGNVGTVSTPTDGSVTANKIGTGAVTSAKIADGTIVNADINASAGIDTSKLGTGAVLQVVQNTSSTMKEISDNTFATTDFAVTIVPKLSTSKLLLTVSVYITIPDSGQGSINIYSSADSALITDKTNGFGGPYGNMDGSSLESINTINFLTDAVGSTSSRTYTLYGKSTGTDPTYFMNSTRLSTFTIMEIGG